MGACATGLSHNVSATGDQLGQQMKEKAMPASNRRANDRGEFKDKRVLVTGGTKGAGKAIADRFLQGGATVAITARSAPTEKTPAYYIQADVSTSQGTSK